MSESLALPPPARLAVLGDPIAHSRSPRIHRAAYSALELPWRYTAIRLRPSALAPFLESRGPDWRGFSVTAPLKAEAARCAVALDPVAQETGVVNTLLRLAGARAEARWAGFNTDVPGLARALEQSGMDLSHTVILGAGATATSALLAARQLGAESVRVLARRETAAVAAADRYAGLAVGGSLSALPPGPPPTAVIATLPGPVGHDLVLPAEIAAVPLFDVAYDPWPSPLARRWRDAGVTAHSGIAMLVEQALVQVRIFRSGAPSMSLPEEARVLAEMHAAGVGG